MYVTHNASYTPEYRAWQQMKARCLNPNHRYYPDYGGRGIGVYHVWVDSFETFLADVGQRPSDKHSLDRIDNDRGYEPGNVKWSTYFEQNHNRRPHRGYGTRQLRPVRDDGRPTNFKHGMVGTPEYRTWDAMKTRCLNPKSANYPDWGGRGITIYEPWVQDFQSFYAYVGPRPSPSHSIDRIDNDRGYEPGNVRWATKAQQSDNRRPLKTGPDHANFKHGLRALPEYSSWGSMKTRCFNPNDEHYADNGGRGTTVCAAWKNDFEAFLRDLGSKPTLRHTLYRENREGHYSCGKCDECQVKGWPSNCRWATQTEQNRNRRGSERSGKLDESKVTQIRALLSEGHSQQKVATMFGVARSLVGKIHRRENWA
jgi:hypothetical protein